MNPTTFTIVLAALLIVYMLVMFAISIWAQSQIHSSEDYVVAGRRLPLSLAWATILATWFGAATVLTQSDEVRQSGLSAAALDPLGAGLCLILAGLFFAVPLWKMGLLTVSDFFRKRYGPAAELLSACIMVPSYFGWIATQFVAMSALLQSLFGGNFYIWLIATALIGMSYTLMGGMWSVTLTDAIQIALVLIGLVLLFVVALVQLGGGYWLGGLRVIFQQPDPRHQQFVPRESLREFSIWLGVLCIGIFGNIPGQDLMQRVFSAKSANVARWACLVAGVMYLFFGMIPVLLALASVHFQPGIEENIIYELGSALLHPLPFIVFLLALMSAILSTIDSAILSPASVLSENVFERFNRGRISSLTLNRAAVVLVTVCSLVMAYLGESAYSLLEGAYELTMVGLFIPLALGIYLQPRGQAPAVASMCVGTGIWLLHYAAAIVQPIAIANGAPWLQRIDLNWNLFLGFVPLHRALAATLAGLIVWLICWQRAKRLAARDD